MALYSQLATRPAQHRRPKKPGMSPTGPPGYFPSIGTGPARYGAPTNAGSVGNQTPGPVRPNQQKPFDQIGTGPPKYTPKPPPVVPPKPRTPTPLPVDPQYDQQMDLIQRGLAGTQADLLHQGQQASQEYGIDDASNPFSRAAFLERSYKRARGASQNSYAARGQLYSGSLSRAQTDNAYQFQSGTDSLQRSYDELRYGLTKRGTEATRTAEDARLAAQDDRIARALANRPDAPPAPYKPKQPGKAKPKATKREQRFGKIATDKPRYRPSKGRHDERVSLPQGNVGGKPGRYSGNRRRKASYRP